MRDDLIPSGPSSSVRSDRVVSVARRQRRQMTLAEKALWFELRQRKLEGSHFRRQAVIGPFVVDFAAHGAMLVIELDGGVDRMGDIAPRDSERTQWIERRGYKIVRFSNAQVMENAGAIADNIAIEAHARMRVIAMMRACDPFKARAEERID